MERLRYLSKNYPEAKRKQQKLESVIADCQTKYGVCRQTVYNDLKRLGLTGNDPRDIVS
ncbi:hypothetical protein FUAX_43640 (plasmid) [Fulvitalea axinellae]|uniref:HTH domain-containing protein n=1 Tax=Fulvitalea axinellae TaxID=1182444 RepID=A0AAU9D2T6_9BACT|nr:hypothetical protein FUAX_43640 [Fulvitalea axinellae]